MKESDRRTGTRFVSDMSCVLLGPSGAPPIDERATAHEVSSKGFKLETQAELAPESVVSFTLRLPQGQIVTGKGRVVWSNRETFATWGGIEIVSMSWSDKRRLARLVDPDLVDWSNLSRITFKLVVALTLVILANRLIRSREMRGVLFELAPKTIALCVMGWAFVSLLKGEKR